MASDERGPCIACGVIHGKGENTLCPVTQVEECGLHVVTDEQKAVLDAMAELDDRVLRNVVMLGDYPAVEEPLRAEARRRGIGNPG